MVMIHGVPGDAEGGVGEGGDGRISTNIFDGTSIFPTT